jgi:hypothetical protein
MGIKAIISVFSLNTNEIFRRILRNYGPHLENVWAERCKKPFLWQHMCTFTFACIQEHWIKYKNRIFIPQGFIEKHNSKYTKMLRKCFCFYKPLKPLLSLTFLVLPLGVDNLSKNTTAIFIYRAPFYVKGVFATQICQKLGFMSDGNAKRRMSSHSDRARDEWVCKLN